MPDERAAEPVRTVGINKMLEELKMGEWDLIPLVKAKQMAGETLRNCRRATETVDLRAALGRISAINVINPEDQPSFDRSTVDGFALQSIISKDALPEKPVRLDVVGEVRMGRPAGAIAGKEQAYKIPTGGMLPTGADAVVMMENTRSIADGGVLILRPVSQGENRTLRGDDAPGGTVVVSAGKKIGAADLGILAACGVDRVTVVKKPIVTVLTTGDEIIAPGEQPEPGQIRDVNSFTLTALAEEAGCEVSLPRRISDDPDLVLAALTSAVAESDIVLISGGSSVGERDFTTSAVQKLPEVKILFHGVALKPGKPSLMAMVGETAVFGIPGHTVAAMTVFQEIVAPAISERLGIPHEGGHFIIQAQLGEKLRPDTERDEIFRVRLERQADKVIAWPLPARSGLITVMSRADGMVYARAGGAELPAGEVIEVEVLLDRISGTWKGAVR